MNFTGRIEGPAGGHHRTRRLDLGIPLPTALARTGGPTHAAIAAAVEIESALQTRNRRNLW